MPISHGPSASLRFSIASCSRAVLPGARGAAGCSGAVAMHMRADVESSFMNDTSHHGWAHKHAIETPRGGNPFQSEARGGTFQVMVNLVNLPTTPVIIRARRSIGTRRTETSVQAHWKVWVGRESARVVHKQQEYHRSNRPCQWTIPWRPPLLPPFVCTPRQEFPSC